MNHAASHTTAMASALDSARPHTLTTPAYPTSALWLILPEYEVRGMEAFMRDTLPDDLIGHDLSRLSNVSRDEDIQRSAFLTWWYAHTDWSAYSADPRWTAEGTEARAAAAWELQRIHAALAPYGRAHTTPHVSAPIDMLAPWLLGLDAIDVEAYIRIRLGYRQPHHEHDTERS